jgi:hypothetical protein
VGKGKLERKKHQGSIGLFKNEEIFSKFLFIACDVWKKNVFGD